MIAVPRARHKIPGDVPGLEGRSEKASQMWDVQDLKDEVNTQDRRDEKAFHSLKTKAGGFGHQLGLDSQMIITLN